MLPDVKPFITTQLLRHEDDPVKRGAMADPDFEDDTLGFGAMHMIQGRAFSLPDNRGDAGSDRRQVPVGKRWVESEGRSFVVEAVELSGITANLKTLPAAPKPTVRREVASVRQFPNPSEHVPGTSVFVKIAQAPREPKGLVLDYTLYTGSDSMTFLSGVTYLLVGPAYIWTSTVMQSSTVVKFQSSSSGDYTLDMWGSITTPSSLPYAAFTSKDDNSIGEIIPGSTGIPINATVGSARLCFHNSTSYLYQNLLVRYAIEGIYFCNSSYNSYTISNSRLEYCTIGLEGYNTLVTMQGVYMCSVPILYDTNWGWWINNGINTDCGTVATPYFVPSGCSFETSLSVSISSTLGAAIYYTTDGSNPTTNSYVYTGPLTLTNTTNLKAKATRAGWNDSPIGIAVYSRAPTLPEGMDAPDFTWTTGGDTYWIGCPVFGYYGGDCVGSKALGDNQSTWIQTQVTGPGRVEFYWKVSSEPGYDMLWFSVDAIDRFGTSGENGWYWNYYELSSGTHTLRWTYRKNASGRGGADCAWVDYFRFIGADSDYDGLPKGSFENKCLIVRQNSNAIE
jgi:hypothetical protein